MATGSPRMSLFALMFDLLPVLFLLWMAMGCPLVTFRALRFDTQFLDLCCLSRGSNLVRMPLSFVDKRRTGLSSGIEKGIFRLPPHSIQSVHPLNSYCKLPIDARLYQIRWFGNGGVTYLGKTVVVVVQWLLW